jgi:organic hydroperoxide reductase OsmC/OhrA
MSHILWFLSPTTKNEYTVKSYKNTAEGVMEKNKEGKLAITEVILKPLVTFEDSNKLNSQIFDELHDKTHQHCSIAHSVKTEIIIVGKFEIS